jgi:hypothetical protein
MQASKGESESYRAVVIRRRELTLLPELPLFPELPLVVDLVHLLIEM